MLSPLHVAESGEVWLLSILNGDQHSCQTPGNHLNTRKCPSEQVAPFMFFQTLEPLPMNLLSRPTSHNNSLFKVTPFRAKIPLGISSQIPTIKIKVIYTSAYTKTTTQDLTSYFLILLMFWTLLIMTKDSFHFPKVLCEQAS